MASTTAPRAKKEALWIGHEEAQRPDRAERPSTSGCWRMLFRPSTARVRNQISMMGANSRCSTAAVPCFWMANSRGQHQHRERHYVGVQEGATIFRPSMADITDMAGVITTSP